MKQGINRYGKKIKTPKRGKLEDKEAWDNLLKQRRNAVNKKEERRADGVFFSFFPFFDLFFLLFLLTETDKNHCKNISSDSFLPMRGDVPTVIVGE